MTDQTNRVWRLLLLIGFCVFLSILLGAMNLYMSFAPRPPEEEGLSAPVETPPPTPRSESEIWADIGDSLLEIAERNRGEMKARETAAWCYERSLDLKEDAGVRDKLSKIRDGALMAEAEKAEIEGAWDVAFDLYSRLHESNPTPRLEKKLEEAKAKRASLYYTYAGRAEEAMRAKRFDEAIELYGKALSCMDHEEGRRCLLIAKVEQQKEKDGSTAKSPSLTQMGYREIFEFFKNNAGSRIRVTGGIRSAERTPGPQTSIRVVGNNTYVTLRTPSQSRPVTVTGVFSGADFPDHLIDYGEGDEIEMVGTVLPSSAFSSFLLQASSIQKVDRPETFASIETGRILPIPDEVRKERLKDYDMVYRNPNAFKGKVMRSTGRVTDITFEEGATVVTVAKRSKDKEGYYSLFTSYLPTTRVRFEGGESFDWFLDYDKGNDVEFECEIEGVKNEKGGSSFSPMHFMVLARRPATVLARGISIQKKGQPDTLVKADGGRAEAVGNPGTYLARCDIVGRDPVKFKGKVVSFRVKLSSVSVEDDFTVLRGYASRKITVSKDYSRYEKTGVTCYFPGGDFVDNFMDYVPGEQIQIGGIVSEKNKPKGSQHHYFGRHARTALYLTGTRAARVGRPATAVRAGGRPTHPENVRSLRKRCYVIGRNISRYVGTTVAWKGTVYDLETQMGSVCVELRGVDPEGDFEGQAVLCFKGSSHKKKLQDFKNKRVLFTGRVVTPSRDSSSIVLEAIRIELLGDPDSRIEVPQPEGEKPGEKEPVEEEPQE